MKVAPRKTTSGYRNGVGCMVCALPDDALQRVNAEIWDSDGTRRTGYRARGARAFYAAAGRAIEVKTITAHAEHIEGSWREVTTQYPAIADEIPVFPSDYASIVERAAQLGAYAMNKLEGRVHKGNIEDRDMISLAKLGVTARAQQESTRVAENRPATQVALIFGLASGHLAGALPDHEVIDVTAEEELFDEVRAERKALAEHATRGATPTDDAPDFDAIF